MRAALALARQRAKEGALLSLDLVSELHAAALGGDPVFRSTPAYAKGGAERYGYDETLFARLADALDQADDAGVPLLGRAARAYLDVCFFHPFVDGNARTARLVFDLILAREGVILADPGALFRHPIPAGDADATYALLRLLERLARP